MFWLLKTDFTTQGLKTTKKQYDISWTLAGNATTIKWILENLQYANFLKYPNQQQLFNACEKPWN